MHRLETYLFGAGAAFIVAFLALSAAGASLKLRTARPDGPRWPPEVAPLECPGTA